MFAGLKATVATIGLLSLAAHCWADQPMRSRVDGGRPARLVRSNQVQLTAGSSFVGLKQPAANETADAAPAASASVLAAGAADCQACSQDFHGCWLHGGQGRGGCGDGGCGRGCGRNGCGGHGCGGHGFATRCNLIPHVAYINPLASYYYFRPYQAFHIRFQQMEVVSYGGDPRQPYSNLMFQGLYPELEAEWAEDAARNQSPFEDDSPHDAAPTPATPPQTSSSVPQRNT